jgi:hypothetical protein
MLKTKTKQKCSPSCIDITPPNPSKMQFIEFFSRGSIPTTDYIDGTQDNNGLEYVIGKVGSEVRNVSNNVEVFDDASLVLNQTTHEFYFNKPKFLIETDNFIRIVKTKQLFKIKNLIDIEERGLYFKIRAIYLSKE